MRIFRGDAMKTTSIIKKTTATVFLLMLAVVFLKKNTIAEARYLAKYLSGNLSRPVSEKMVAAGYLETKYSSGLPFEERMLDINGALARIFHIRGLYSDMGMYITRDYRVVSCYKETSTDYEYEQTVKLKEFLDKNGVHLLYVNKPTKYLNDGFFPGEFGEETYSNRNADKLIARLREEDIPVIDLREEIVKENKDIKDVFYRTDHHWTTPSALWATGIIAEGLNEYCGYNIDTDLYNESNYDMQTWKKCWLGEQGRKIGKTYVGLDDFTKITPAFETDYTMKDKDGNYQGTFEDFILEDTFNLQKSVYKNRSWHYSYEQKNSINNNADYGKVLLLGDSFDQTTVPFLSLGVHQLDSMIMRERSKSFNLGKYIKEHGYDTVIVCYAQLMIGAHDRPESSNYKMFSFFRED